jgi:lipopolysaccharide/colanic/teichoic acid biosynthesis glycosyltransferase
MSNTVAEARFSPFGLRYAVILGYDAIATVCGLYAALLLSHAGELPPQIAAGARAAAPLLVLIRLAAVMTGRFHQWSFRASGLVDMAKLALFMSAASVVFAVCWRRLPWPVYVMELSFTTGLMAAFRFAPRLAEDFSEAASIHSQAVLRFAMAERPRRALNVFVALLGIAVTFPLWILIGMAIKLTSRGPVFYKQERIGLDLRSVRSLENGSRREHDPRRKHDLGGRPFMMYKFRTMTVDAESSTGAVWCAKQDSRVTAVGRFLRHCRLDELPQLINVLKGDMNVVGPRPERPSIFAELRAKIPNYSLRQRARPGITGYAQVNLEYDSSIDDVARKLKYDLQYLQKQGVAADLHIMVKTIPVMLFRDKVLSRAPGSGPDSLVEEKTGASAL